MSDTPRRKITLGEDGARMPDAAGFLAGMGNYLGEIAAFNARLDKAEAANKTILKALDRIQELLTGFGERLKSIEAYPAEHAKVHRDLNLSHGTQVNDLIKLVRNVAGQITASHDVLGSAMVDMAKRREIPVVLETKVEAGPVNITNTPAPEEAEESESYVFDVKRNPAGLIQSVVARPIEEAE